MGIGFTARTCSNYRITTATSTLRDFTVVDNKGGHFQPSTGVFTAPASGLYTVGLKHDERIDIPAQFDVVHESQGAQDGGGGDTLQAVVAEACTAAHLIGGVSSIVKCIWMEEGDRLYVRLSMLNHGEFTLLFPSMFHCYLTE